MQDAQSGVSKEIPIVHTRVQLLRKQVDKITGNDFSKAFKDLYNRGETVSKSAGRSQTRLQKMVLIYPIFVWQLLVGYNVGSQAFSPLSPSFS